MNNANFVAFARKLRRERNMGRATRLTQAETRFINIALNERASEIYVALHRERRRIVEMMVQFV